MKHLIIDLDETLIDTSKLRPFMLTQKGREFVIENYKDFPTRIYDNYLKRLVKYFHNNEKLSIITNSPLKYAKNLLAKHNFPSDLNIIANAKKPNPLSLENLVNSSKTSKKNTLIIGDSASDIIAAHCAGISAAAVSWGTYSTKNKLRESEPYAICENIDDLEKIIQKFEEGKIRYKRRSIPEQYCFFPQEEFYSEIPEINFMHLETYYPVREANEFTWKILNFKESRHYNAKEIKDGARVPRMSHGEIIYFERYIDILKEFRCRTENLIRNIQGKSLIITSPNSFPECCYKSNVNSLLCHNLARRIESLHYEKNMIKRLFPKIESYSSGKRSLETHLKTIGFLSDNMKERFENIIIFDDIKTSGNQIIAIANILKYLGYDGKYYGITLGETRDSFGSIFI